MHFWLQQWKPYIEIYVYRYSYVLTSSGVMFCSLIFYKKRKNIRKVNNLLRALFKDAIRFYDYFQTKMAAF